MQIGWRVLSLLALGCTVREAHAQPRKELSSSAASDPNPATVADSPGLREQRARKLAAESELAVLPDVQRSLEETLARDVRALYRLKRGGLLPLAGGLQTFMTHASRVAHLERMARRTLSELDKTRAGREQLAKEVQLLDGEIAAGEQLRATLAEESAELAPIASDVGELARNNDVGTVGERFPVEDRLGYGLSLVGDEAQPRLRSFAAEKGALALPVSAPSSVQTANDGYALALVTQQGASVRAAADGRVVFAQKDERGELSVVVDHGRRYRTHYRGLERVDVEVGDAVSKSARLGSTAAAAITFEVRRASRALDARSWLGL